MERRDGQVEVQSTHSFTNIRSSACFDRFRTSLRSEVVWENGDYGLQQRRVELPRMLAELNQR